MTTVECGPIVSVHKDARREISEFNGEGFSLQSFEIFERLPLGNHFHTNKNETFVILEGGASLLTKLITADSTDVVHTRTVSKGDVVRIPPMVAHTFLLEPGSKMMCFSSVPFNPDDMDMTPHKLV